MAARHFDWRRTADPCIGGLFQCLSGYEAERHRDFEGKRTVQTLHGFDKPVLNAYRLLARLGGELVASRIDPADLALSSIAARDRSSQLSIVVTHFRNDRIESDGPARMVKLKVTTPWPDGTRVELRHLRIDADHSNAHTVFCRLGKPNPPTPDQARQIKHRMGLEPLEPPRHVVVQGQLELSFDLPCNAVSLVELIKAD
jgi:xylan 1,4-beta-xylosidase